MAGLLSIKRHSSIVILLGGEESWDWFLFLVQAAGPGIIGHVSLNWVLKFVKAPIVSVSVLGESVGATLLAFVIFHEALA